MKDIKDIPKENLEIERKFLLKNVPSFSGDVDVLMIHQIYVKVDGENVRFRHTRNMKSLNSVYHKCIKSKLSHGVFEEIENEVTEDEFNNMEEKDHRYTIKKRYVYKEGGLNWEIDEYLEIKMATIEVELDDINQEIKIPKFLKDLIIIELTGKKEFSNHSLSLKSK